MKYLIRTTLAVFVLLQATVSFASSDAEPRQSLTSQGNGIARGHVGDGQLSFDEYAALQTEGSRSKHDAVPDQQKPGSAMSQSINTDFWFYDVDVELFSDFDRDGYFFGIDLLFDADTYYTVADVYAVIYLSYEYGPWNEYAVTDNFTLFGSSATDEYIVETELVSGYPTGSYDILIELFDAYDDTLVASIGPDEASELALLPLEDSTYDAVTTGNTQIVVNSGGGGSLSWLLLLSLLAVRMTLRPQAAMPSK